MQRLPKVSMDGIHLLLAVFAILAASPFQLFSGAAEQPTRKPVILLVHGMTVDLDNPTLIWGEPEKSTTAGAKWSGAVGFLEQQGYRFGGVIRPRTGKLSLPATLDSTATNGDSKTADLFALAFSKGTKEDGLVSKAMELSKAISELCKFTGSSKVHLVTHSAGGVVARFYLQGGLLESPYRGDVDRLITIGTPHLGSVLATHFGDFLGTRATSLKHDAQFIRDMNAKLDLPEDVKYASIIIRGIRRDTSNEGDEYDELADSEYLRPLPNDFKLGGDQVVHVKSQNLRLSPCARRYEKKTGKAVQCSVARVVPSKKGLIHGDALNSLSVQRLVKSYLQRNDGCWTGNWSLAERGRWVDDQARLCVFDCTEQAYDDLHLLFYVKHDEFHFEFLDRIGDQWSYRFRCEGSWDRKIFGKGVDRVAGNLVLSTDRFGRVRGLTSVIDEKASTSDEDNEASGESALIERASRHYADKEYALAIAKYQQAAKLSRDKSKTNNGLEQSYNELARAWFKRDERKAYAFRALARRYSGAYSDAIADYDRLIQIDPEKKADHLAGRGVIYNQQRKYNEAIFDFTQAIKLGTKLDWIENDLKMSYFWRGKRAFESDKPEMAIADFDEVLWRNPRETNTYDWRGRAYHRIGNYDLAIADFNTYLESRSKLTGADWGYFFRAHAYDKLGIYKPAIDDLEELIRLDPKLPHGYRMLARVLAACPKDEFRDGKRALELATKANTLTDPNDCTSRIYLAIVNGAIGEFDAASRWLEKTREHASFEKMHATFRDLHKEVAASVAQKKPYRYTMATELVVPKRHASDDDVETRKAFAEQLGRLLPDTTELIATVNLRQLSATTLAKELGLLKLLQEKLNARKDTNPFDINIAQADRVTFAGPKLLSRGDTVAVIYIRSEPKELHKLLEKLPGIKVKSVATRSGERKVFEHESSFAFVAQDVIVIADNQELATKLCRRSEDEHPPELSDAVSSMLTMIDLRRTISAIAIEGTDNPHVQVSVSIGEDARLDAIATCKNPQETQEAFRQVEFFVNAFRTGSEPSLKKALADIVVQRGVNTIRIRLRVPNADCQQAFHDYLEPMFSK
jgi:tetratricopeptide (TPR) repeat protein